AVPVLFACVGCDEKLADLTGPTPNLTPTLSSIQRDIFSASDSSGRSACVSCHTPGGFADVTGLFLTDPATSFAALVGRGSRLRPGETLVIPGDPDNSYLVRKLEGGPAINGLRMPRNNGPFLTDGQMLVIRRWIAAGAAND
ncbi:MAG: hypothetical protein R2694_00015, partial [Ilumatobacteraceae bacterium]